MTTMHVACCACGVDGPAAMLATIDHTGQLALCHACMRQPAALRAFVARFDRACRDADHDRAAHRYHTELDAAAQRVSGYGDPHAA